MKKINWLEYFKLKYGIDKTQTFKADYHDPNFNLPLSNLYKEY